MTTGFIPLLFSLCFLIKRYFVSIIQNHLMYFKMKVQITMNTANNKTIVDNYNTNKITHFYIINYKQKDVW